jgi:hypothetical protein
VSLHILLENSFQIAWEYLDATGELGDRSLASRFLGDSIEAMIRRGERRKILLANKAIERYRSVRNRVVILEDVLTKETPRSPTSR